MPNVEFLISGTVIAAGFLNFKAPNSGIILYCRWNIVF